MDYESLKKTHDSISMLRELGLPVNDDLLKEVGAREKQYLQEEVIPKLIKEIEPLISSVRSNFHIYVNYNPGDGVECSLESRRNFSPSINENVSTRDLTKYSIDGGQPLGKRRFVLAVIKKYVKEHPYATLEELESRFPSSLSHSLTYGVVRDYNQIKNKISSQPDLEKRFMLNDDDIITLYNGVKVVVYNQWGHTFDKFLEVAKKLYNIESFER